ncbi:MAG: hypothetical protein KDB53_01860 [Planctomycetes bacterium]|nr:hypothetical protein [Planctomycetota bacterium]
MTNHSNHWLRRRHAGFGVLEVTMALNSTALGVGAFTIGQATWMQNDLNLIISSVSSL